MRRETDAVGGLLSLLLVAVLIQGSHAVVRVCVPSIPSGATAPTQADYISRCKTYFETYVVPGGITVNCSLEATQQACADGIKNGQYDVSRMSGEDMYASFKEDNLIAIAAENYGTSITNYYSVAVVKASSCPSSATTIMDFKGKNSCHTNYRGTAGWTLPMGYMIRNSMMNYLSSAADVRNDAESVGIFFNSTCAPGTSTTADGPRNGATRWDSLCDACQGDCSRNAATEFYSNYDGALRGLNDGACEITFTKHDIPTTYFKNGTNAARITGWVNGGPNKDDLRLLCPTGGCRSVDDFAACNWGRAAAHGWMSTAAWNTSTEGAAFLTGLISAANNPQFLLQGTTAALNNNTGMNLNNFPVQVTTVSIDRVSSFGSLMSQEVQNAYEAIRDTASRVRVCVPSIPSGATAPNQTDYLARCKNYFETYVVPNGTSVICYLQATQQACADGIRDGLYDVTRMSGEDMYASYKEDGLTAIAAENYGLNITNYYSVAVVKTASCPSSATSITDFRGRNSCHTNYRGTAGWTLPVGYMLRNSMMSFVSAAADVRNDAEAVAAFFNRTCAPGTSPTADGPRNGGTAWSTLCEACQGDCSRNAATEAYSNYDGALRGLNDGACEIAFTKHDIPTTYVKDGSNAARITGWANGGSNKTDFRLLCPNGGCRTVDEFDSCNWGRAAAHGWMAKAAWTTTNDGAAFINGLISASTNTQFLATGTAAALNNNSGMNLNNFPVQPTTVRIDRITAFNTLMPVDVQFAYEAIRDTATRVRVCVPSIPSGTAAPTVAQYLARCKSYFETYVAPGTIFTCFVEATQQACADGVRDDRYDVTRMSGEDMYASYKEDGLTAIAAENYGSSITNYYSVAVVKAASCPSSTTTIADFRGRKSCHTNYRGTAGWTLPVGLMLRNSMMSYVSSVSEVRNDAESIASFFSRTCAPGTSSTADGPRDGATRWDNLCTACQGDCTRTPATEFYSNYDGALRGLNDGACDITFTKHDIPTTYVKDGSNAARIAGWVNGGSNKTDFRLLCPTGGCRSVDEYSTCNWGRAAAHGWMSKPAWATTPAGVAFLNGLTTAASNNPQFLTLGTTAALNNNSGMNLNNFPVQATTERIDRVASFDLLMPREVQNAYEAIRDTAPRVRVCVPSIPSGATAPTSADYLARCKSYFETYVTPGTIFTCSLEASQQACAEGVKNGLYDVTRLSGEDMYSGYKDSGLTAIAAENYGASVTNYYSVAVVKAASCPSTGTPTINDFKGKKSCHTNYRGTAGWTLPVGYMLRNNMMSYVSSAADVRNDAEAVASFFSRTCAPGTSLPGNGPRNGATRWDPLCTACQGDCTRNVATEFYSNYDGALRGLNDGACEITFTKHDIPTTYVKDGSNVARIANWTNGGPLKADLRLLCPTGGCRNVDDFATCNWGRAAAHGWMSKSAWATSTVGVSFINGLTSAATNNPQFLTLGTTVATNTNNGLNLNNFPVQATTVRIDPVTSFNALMPQEVQNAYEAIRDSSNIAVRICVPSLPSGTGAPSKADYETRCSAFFRKYWGPLVTCTAEANAQLCADGIRDGKYDLTKISGEDIYVAAKQKGLVPVAAEDYGTSGTRYYGVAVVRKEFCDAMGPSINIASLRGKRSCHTNYRGSAGWTLPFGLYFSTGQIPAVDNDATVNNDAESVANFFSKTCAPGVFVTADGPKKGALPWANLCTACKGDCSRTAAEPYQSYDGSLRGMVEGACDVAFTKHDIATTYVLGGANQDRITSWTNKTTSEDLRLMCPTGGCRRVEDWGSCNFGRAAAHAWMSTAEWYRSTAGQTFAAAMIRQSTAAFVAEGSVPATSGGVFLSSFPVQSTTVELVSAGGNFDAFMSPDLRQSYEQLRSEIVVVNARFCNVGDEEQAFCERALPILNGANLGATFSCVKKASNTECLQAIKNNEAELRTFDGGNIYSGWKDFGLRAIVSEDYGVGNGAEYYAVAVVKKGMCSANTKLSDLRGKVSCHTGYGRSVGWTMPVGQMLAQNVAPVIRSEKNVQADAQSVSRFFSRTCAPGTNANGPMRAADGTPMKYERLCTACKGDCSGTSTEPYQDYAGALRCLVETGDVAFVKHSTVSDFAADGRSPQSWSTLKQADVQLLCPTGGCMDVSQYLQCNLARVPAHAVMVRGSYEHAGKIQKALQAASTISSFRAMVFVNNSKSFLFKQGTLDLDPIITDTRSFIGDSALAAYQALIDTNNGANLVNATQTVYVKKNKNDLDGGAIAGIVIGCSVGVALIVGLVMYIVMKRRVRGFTKYTGTDGAQSVSMVKMNAPAA